MAVTDLPAGCVLHGVPFGQPCFTCTTMAAPSFWAPVIPVPGWLCPQCQRSIAPSAVTCPFCGPVPQVTAGTPPGPFTPVLPVPVDGDPGERLEPRARKYPAGGPGCPGCNPGAGEAAKPDAGPETVHGGLPPGPLIRLPPHMDSPGFAWHARIAGRWRELFTGLQARRPSVSHDEENGAVADIEFRVTPQDGQDRD